jgi:hypothetical protein
MLGLSLRFAYCLHVDAAAIESVVNAAPDAVWDGVGHD